MKKLAIAAAAVASLSAGVANAYTMGTFSNGVVVPNVIHNGDAQTTVVGFINQSGGTRAIYWTFFDQDSKHITDGCFSMTDRDYAPFIWSKESGVGLAGKRGYLVFGVGATTTANNVAGTCSDGAPGLLNNAGNTAGAAAALISANAFYVDVAGKDVAYNPVIDGPLAVQFIAAAPNLKSMNEASLLGAYGAVTITGAAAAAPWVVNGSERFSMRYFIDGAAGGDDTNIVVWSTGDQKRSHTVDMYNDNQGRKSVNFVLKQTELDYFDVEGIVGRPADYKDGFIEWDVNAATFGSPAAVTINGTDYVASVFTYSVVQSPTFGAIQTLLGAHSN